MNTILLQAQGQGGGMGMIIMLVVLFAIMYFFMIRPQNKKQKEIQKFRNELTVGQDAAIISFRRLSLAVPVTICIFAG